METQSFRECIVDFAEQREDPVSRTVWLESQNHNQLLELLSNQLEIIRSAFSKYGTGNYQIQGKTDRGVDVAAFEDSDGGRLLTAVQVKSHREIIDKNKSVITTVKTQFGEAMAAHGNSLGCFVVLLCGNAEVETVTNAARAICNTYLTAQNVRVIKPRHAARFLRLPGSKLRAMIEARLLQRDPVIRALQNSCEPVRLMTLALLLALFETAITENCLNVALRDALPRAKAIYNINVDDETRPDFDDAMAFDTVDDLAGQRDEAAQSLRLSLSQDHLWLSAVLDRMSRHSITASEAIEQLWHLLSGSCSGDVEERDDDD